MALLPPVATLQVELIGLDVLRRAPGAGLRGAHQREPEGLHDRGCDLVLQREDVLQLAVVALRPEVVAVGGADQEGRDPQAAAGLPHAPLEDAIDPQLAPDAPHVVGASLELEGGGACRHPQALHLGQ